MAAEINHAKRAHALLSASASHRWLACTPSALLESKVQDTSSEFAKEGTLAHEFCDLKLRLYTRDIKESTYKKNISKLRKDEMYQKEMEEYADDYFIYVMEKLTDTAVLTPETQVDFSEYVPEGFGTSDAIIIDDGKMTIIDFKYGKGVEVSAVDNPQLRLYSLGALHTFSMIYDINIIDMCIFQPRIGNISEDSITVDELLEWGEYTVKHAAALAFKGEGKRVAGDHCKFCKIRNKCPAMYEYSMSVVSDYFDIEEPETWDKEKLRPEDYASILSKSKPVKTWLGDIESYCIEHVLSGELKVPGYKLVEGRSIRKFTDIDKAIAEIVADGYDESTLYERVPLSLSKMEKLIGKAQFNKLVASFIEKPKGKPTIVVETDKRPEYSLADDFENEGEN